jgi:integrase/recombinase XerD
LANQSSQSLIRSKLAPAEAQAIRVVLDGLPSEHSRRAYERALADFFHWHKASGRPQQCPRKHYAAGLRDAGMAASRVNQRLSAIRKLAMEAADNDALDPAIANDILAVKGARRDGRRTGNWLTRECR